MTVTITITLSNDKGIAQCYHDGEHWTYAIHYAADDAARGRLEALVAAVMQEVEP